MKIKSEEEESCCVQDCMLTAFGAVHPLSSRGEECAASTCKQPKCPVVQLEIQMKP